jgi:O-antigen ligase
MAAALTIPYIAAIYLAESSFIETSLLIASVLSMMWMLVMTASRSGMLNVIFSIALTSLFILRGNPRGKVIGAGIVLILLVAISLAPGVFWQRMQTVWSDTDKAPSETATSARGSEAERLAVLNRSIKYTFENPIFGLGLGNLAVASGTELGRPDAWMGAHNTFTQISSEAGLPALGLFIFLLWTTLRGMKKLDRESTGPEGSELKLMARATQVSLLSFMFGAFFAHIAYEYFLFYPVAIGVALQHAAGTMPTPPTVATEVGTSEPHTSVMDYSL